MECLGHYLAFGVGYFDWMSATTFKILASVTAKSWVSTTDMELLSVGFLVCLTSLELGQLSLLCSYQW